VKLSRCGHDVELVDRVSASVLVACGMKVAWSLKRLIGLQKGPGAVPRFVLRSIAKTLLLVILRNGFVFEEAWCCPLVAGVGIVACELFCGMQLRSWGGNRCFLCGRSRLGGA
jgi:hypothetical protein